jgi:hypothetical protein
MSFDHISVTVCKTDVDGPIFHSVDLYEEHDTTFVLEGISATAERAGWEIVSIVVHYDDFWQHEVVSGSVTFDDALELFEILCAEDHQTGSILAFVQENGIRNLSDWEDCIRYEGGSKAEIAQEYFEVMELTNLYEEIPGKYFGQSEFRRLESLPSILQVDWDATLDNIQANEGMSVTYLNGTWYMFS